MPANTPTTSQLKRALEIAERIEQLQQELDAILGGSSKASAPAPASSTPVAKRGRRKGNLSPEARERIAAAQRARWAKVKGTAAPESAAASAPAKKKAGRKGKRVISAEARAKMAEAARRRWAAAKKK